MTKTIKVLFKPVGGPLQEKTIPNELAACQALVGGYIETVPLCEDLVLICNEEGRILGLPRNPLGGRDLYGDWFLCGTRGEEFADAPEGYREIVGAILARYAEWRAERRIEGARDE